MQSSADFNVASLEAAELSLAHDSPACKAQRKRTDSTGRSPGPPGKETGMKRADFYLCVYQKNKSFLVKGLTLQHDCQRSGGFLAAWSVLNISEEKGKNLQNTPDFCKKSKIPEKNMIFKSGGQN